MKHEEDRIGVTPTIDGPYARAWLVAGKQERQHSGVALWLVEAPWAHPLWHSYRISLIHLRPVPGLDDAYIALAGATHEIMVFALHPDHPREQIFRTNAWSTMSPANFGAQFIEDSDEAAAERIKRTVDLICQAKLSPDTDYIRAWADMFGDNLMRETPPERLN